jgi:hypothetical protein
VRAISRRPPRRLALSGLLLALIQLGGCRFAGELVGAAAGGASAAASANPAVGIAVGVGVQAGVDATVSFIVRKRQQAEQDAIAGEIAGMHTGERRPWKIEHDIPIGNEHGVVQVIRAFDTSLTSCKEIAFSIETDSNSAATRTYTTQACRNGERWKWALAEPAVERWGSLQ